MNKKPVKSATLKTSVPESTMRAWYKYVIVLYWSQKDNAFIAEVPELPVCMAHGKTHESALKNAKSAMRLWIKTSREFGDPIPKPKGRRLVFA